MRGSVPFRLSPGGRFIADRSILRRRLALLGWTLLLVLCVVMPVRSALAAPQQGPGSTVSAESAGSPASFRIEELAEGVLLFRPNEGRQDLTNSLVVAREDGLLVVDAQPTPGAASAFLSDLASVLGQKPRYLVLTHPHAEAAGGASAFPASTLVVATNGLSEALADPDFDFGAEMRQRSRKGARWQEPPRVQPTLVLFNRARLEDPSRPVELLPLPPAHTKGDLIVQLPEQQIIYAGAVLNLDRNPYAAHANVGGWLVALNNIAKNHPSIVVPLDGPASPLREVRLMRDRFAWLRGQVELAFVNGLKAPEITDAILKQEDLAERFDTSADPSFLRGLIDQALAEAVEQRRKRGIE